MSFVDNSIAIPIRIRNPFAGLVYPKTGEVYSTLDTGYTGFLFVPFHLFQSLHLRKRVLMKAVLADGSEIELFGDYASIEFPEQHIVLDGLVQSCEPNTNELLLGMDGIRKLTISINSCLRNALVEPCD